MLNGKVDGYSNAKRDHIQRGSLEQRRGRFGLQGLQSQL
jgi:hypothetical protein